MSGRPKRHARSKAAGFRLIDTIHLSLDGPPHSCRAVRLCVLPRRCASVDPVRNRPYSRRESRPVRDEEAGWEAEHGRDR